jgi:hypothetical protein
MAYSSIDLLLSSESLHLRIEIRRRDKGRVICRGIFADVEIRDGSSVGGYSLAMPEVMN